MKKTSETTGTGYVLINLFLSIASFDTAYAFYVSAANGDKWFLSVIFLLVFMPYMDTISSKHRKIALAAALAAGAAAAVFVISQVGIWILNIRYSAVVYNAAIGVFAAANILLYVSERKNNITAA